MNIFVIGASNIDFIATSKENIINKDSNPGTHTLSFGGVGRNIAYNLGVLGHKITFITTLGQDIHGLSMKDDAQKYMKVVGKKTKTSNYYVAIFNHDNDLEVSVASMDAQKTLKVNHVQTYEKKLLLCDIIVVETNVSEDILAYISKLSHHLKIVELVSSKKAIKCLPYLNGYHVIKGNQIEIRALFETVDTKNIQEKLQNHQTVVMTQGHERIVEIKKNSMQTLLPDAIQVINTSGCGDAFLAGYIDDIHGEPLKRGHEMAKRVLRSKDSTLKEKR